MTSHLEYIYEYVIFCVVIRTHNHTHRTSEMWTVPAQAPVTGDQRAPFAQVTRISLSPFSNRRPLLHVYVTVAPTERSADDAVALTPSGSGEHSSPGNHPYL